MTETIEEVAYTLADLAIQYDSGYFRNKFTTVEEGQKFFVKEMKDNSDGLIEMLDGISGALDYEGPIGNYDSRTVINLIGRVERTARRLNGNHVR